MAETLGLIEDAKGDPRNARTLALAADLVYFAQDKCAEAFRTQLGLEARLLSSGNTQACVATNDDHIVVAFRGTEAPTGLEGLKDWLLTNAVNLLIQPEGDLGTDFAAAGVGARWHQGFMRALGEIWDSVFAAVDAERKKSDRPIWLTGHSLGGALALLAGWRFKRKFVPIHQIYTFGAPMVGNELAAKTIDLEFADKIFRYVNTQDPIPKLPTVSLLANQYGHCQKEIVLGVAAAASEAATSGLAFFQQMASKTVDGVLQGSLLDDFWNDVQARVGAHAMESYCKQLADLVRPS
jgi:hypothetical protein